MVRQPTVAEERANAVTHGVGLLCALAAAAVACVAAAQTGSALRIVTVAIFCLTLVLLYLASTGFHLAHASASRNRWRLFDHASIYALIAGSYTPIMLVKVGGAWGWGVVGTVWALAIVGIALKTMLVGRFDNFERLDLVLYLAMGWMSLVAVVPIVSALPYAALAWLVGGGAFYSFGCIFFAWNGLRYNHAIWHLFVLGGSACHYVLILRYVVMA